MNALHAETKSHCVAVELPSPSPPGRGKDATHATGEHGPDSRQSGPVVSRWAKPPRDGDGATLSRTLQEGTTTWLPARPGRPRRGVAWPSGSEAALRGHRALATPSTLAIRTHVACSAPSSCLLPTHPACSPHALAAATAARGSQHRAPRPDVSASPRQRGVRNSSAEATFRGRQPARSGTAPALSSRQQPTSLAAARSGTAPTAASEPAQSSPPSRAPAAEQERRARDVIANGDHAALVDAVPSRQSAPS